MTGDRNRLMQLYYQLIHSISKAKRIDIIVSFLMESGVRMLLKDLKGALDRGVCIRILTGNYLGITQPSALYLLKQTLGDRVDLRRCLYPYSDRELPGHHTAVGIIPAQADFGRPGGPSRICFCIIRFGLMMLN